ncbi:hypothetical protein [Bizionia arctica]|uniref:DUF4252 domain-containing protein n=1 Tax=Bizionia arctica TaxID=1495645 RepID=A0A917GMF6_9FLAO|nr:hypothetical protein [Bizionia arctica]GGG51613.1 hypothetical protein GCM10010976_23470 [Bizionia arctica]
MNKLISLLFLLLLTQGLYAQQFLWSTIENDDFEYVSIENVTSRVLDIYDVYEYYSDGTGYSKSDFLNIMEKYSGNSKNWEELKKTITEIDNLTVFAIKDNLGNGSVILIVMVSPKGVDIVAFTNNYELDIINTSPYDKEKFEKWFNSLLY